MDGNYVNEFFDFYFGGYRDYFRVGWKCDVYYWCLGGVVSVVKCLNGIIYDLLSKNCILGNYFIGLGC